MARACLSVVHRRHGSLLRRRLPPAHVWVDSSLWPGPPHSLLATAPGRASREGDRYRPLAFHALAQGPAWLQGRDVDPTLMGSEALRGTQDRNTTRPLLGSPGCLLRKWRQR